jgi:hypothetical protein
VQTGHRSACTHSACLGPEYELPWQPAPTSHPRGSPTAVGTVRPDMRTARDE